MRCLLKKGLFLIFTLALAGSAAWLAWAQGSPGSREGAPRLLWVEFLVGGRMERVKAGASLLLHPDAPFKVTGASSDAWWDRGLLSYRISGDPDVDLESLHTLHGLLADKVYNQEGLVVEVMRLGRVLGMVSVRVRLLTIDWLRRAEAAKDLKDKIRFTEKAWEASHGDRLLLYRLADLLMEAERFQEALDLIEAQDAATGDPALLKLLVELYYRAGQTQKAAGALSLLLAEDPKNTQLIARLAQLYEQLNRWEESALLYERLLDEQKGTQRGKVMRHLARLWDKAGDKRKSLAALERAVKWAPLDEGLWQALALARQEMGDQEMALAAWTRAAELAPQNGEVHIKLANALLASGEKRRAAAALETAVDLRPADSGLLARLARIYQDLEDPEGQARAFSRLAALRPDDPDLHYNLAVLALDRGGYQTALKYLERADKAKPGDREILLAKVEALLKFKQWNRALKLTGRLLEENPKDLKLIMMVFPSLAKNRPKEMAAFLVQAQTELPQEAKIYEMRAALALDQDDPGRAEKALSQGVKALSGHAGLWHQLAQVLLARGKKKKALTALGRVVDLDPKNAEAEERFLELKLKLQPRKGIPRKIPRDLDPEPLPPDPKPAGGGKGKP